MAKTFNFAPAFNENIGSWNVARVTDMNNMFYTYPTSGTFNQDIGSWNVAAVSNMRFLFCSASAFNQNIASWNTASVTNMVPTPVPVRCVDCPAVAARNTSTHVSHH
jgi:surface protein